MKRYLAFAYIKYDAFGGMEDFKEDFDDADKAREYLIRNFKKCSVLVVFDMQRGRTHWYEDRYNLMKNF